jgi:hypothetical protein
VGEEFPNRIDEHKEHAAMDEFFDSVLPLTVDDPSLVEGYNTMGSWSSIMANWDFTSRTKSNRPLLAHNCMPLLVIKGDADHWRYNSPANMTGLS